MIRFSKLILFAIVLLLRAKLTYGQENIRYDIEEAILDNGLKVIMVEEHKAPVVTFQVWYKVGSRNEVTGKTGLSHLMEHMMFKGTPKYGKGEFSRLVAKNGGNENAFTAEDYTGYFENFSSDRLNLSLDLESDRMAHLTIDPKEFQLERDVVKEERRMRTDDNPFDFLSEQLNAQSFEVHPYHNPVIGWMTDIDHLTRQDVYEHYKKYYLPNNAILVIVGDFDHKTLLPQIKKYFEQVPKGTAPDAPQIVEPEQKGERWFNVEKEAQIPIVLMGYKTPNFKEPDQYPLTVLSTLLSSGKSSRLYRHLVYEKKIALETGTDYSSLSADPTLFSFFGKPQTGKTVEEIKKALWEEINQIKNVPVNPAELQKAKNQIETQFILSRDSNFFVAMQLGIAESIGAGTHYFDTFLDSIKKVSAEDVQRVARKYFVEEGRTTGILYPLSYKK